MWLLPYRRRVFASAKTKDEVEAAMRAAVAPRRSFGLGAPTRPFEGEVGDGTFNVQRAITYRNSFLPRIRGTISAAPDGSRIAVTMRLHPLVLVFMTVWLGGVGAAILLILAGELRKGRLSSAVLPPATMFIFGASISTGCFAYEARKAVTLLADTMTARLTGQTISPRSGTEGPALRG